MGEEPHENQQRALLREQACDWFVKLRDEQLSRRERLRIVAWFKQSPEHVAEFIRIEQLDTMLRATRLDRDKAGPRTRDEYSNLIVPFARDPLATHPNTPAPRRASWRILSVAAVLVAIVVGFALKAFLFDPTISTAVGQWRMVALSDHTRVLMGPGSKLRVSFGDTQRAVHLIRGEARFEVAKDPARPFLVASEFVRVLALGTTFRVSRQKVRDVVVVTEGTVAVYGGRASSNAGTDAHQAVEAQTLPVISLAAGQQLSVPKLGRATQRKINAEHERAWAEGWLTFENTTVGEIATELNSRNRLQIILEDHEVSAKRLSFFRGLATDPQSFVDALKTDHTLHVEHDRAGDVHVSTRHEPALRSTEPAA